MILFLLAIVRLISEQSICLQNFLTQAKKRNPMKNNLEGGHDAFELRKSKYGF